MLSFLTATSRQSITLVVSHLTVAQDSDWHIRKLPTAVKLVPALHEAEGNTAKWLQIIALTK